MGMMMTRRHLTEEPPVSLRWAAASKVPTTAKCLLQMRSKSDMPGTWRAARRRRPRAAAAALPTRPSAATAAGGGEAAADAAEDAGKKRRKERRAMADLLSPTDALSKPFNYVSGLVSTKKRNPLKKKSGILNVLSRKGERRRIVLKDGHFNLVGVTDGKSHRLLRDFFISSIHLSWSIIFTFFAAVFPALLAALCCCLVSHRPAAWRSLGGKPGHRFPTHSLRGFHQ